MICYDGKIYFSVMRNFLDEQNVDRAKGYCILKIFIEKPRETLVISDLRTKNEIICGRSSTLTYDIKQHSKIMSKEMSTINGGNLFHGNKRIS